jgi:SsrA-binding protein
MLCHSLKNIAKSLPVQYTLFATSMPTLSDNKFARRDYEVLNEVEAGLELLGMEVKPIRAGQMKLKGSFVKIVGGALVLINGFIPKYDKAAGGTEAATYDPYRTRRLLVHKKELKKLSDALDTRGYTLVPLSVYTRGRLIKLKVAIARGRKTHEKKDILKQRDIDRDVRRELKR